MAKAWHGRFAGLVPWGGAQSEGGPHPHLSNLEGIHVGCENDVQDATSFVLIRTIGLKSHNRCTDLSFHLFSIVMQVCVCGSLTDIQESTSISRQDVL